MGFGKEDYISPDKKSRSSYLAIARVQFVKYHSRVGKKISQAENISAIAAVRTTASAQLPNFEKALIFNNLEGFTA